ncbi:MAG: ATP-binding cassette domain-containing protein [Acholeplasmatales bacterium]|nr:ATP-binding cassette domain-containing protein [Acholeplasmatales bacterium]
MLKVIDLEKRYKDIIFDHVSIDMSKPGLYIFQGINGSGKSTILKVIAGIIFKSSGKIEKDVSIAYLPDKYNMPKLMSVMSYVELVLDMYGKKNEASKLIGMYQIPKRRIGELSKGNQQKLGLLQIFSNDCDCYVLDEPIDGLDEFAKHLVKNIVKEKIESGHIIIMSLHGKNLFNELNPKIFDVKDGEIIERKKRKNEEEI